MSRIVVVGSGSWGTAVAVHFDRCGHQVSLVPRRREAALLMLEQRENVEHLPDVAISCNVQIALEWEPSLLEAEFVFLAVPSFALRETCLKLGGCLDEKRALPVVLALSKGLDRETLQFPLELVEEVLPHVPAGVLSGPNRSLEIAQGKPTAAVVGSRHPDLESWVRALDAPTLALQACEDARGVQLGACLKNIYAIGAGIFDGLELGDNAKAAYLTAALLEMMRLAESLGGKMETLYGLSGLGDFMATCYGAWSRNYGFGERLARKGDREALLAGSFVVEGYFACECFHRLLKRKGLQEPKPAILERLYKALYEALPIEEVPHLIFHESMGSGGD